MVHFMFFLPRNSFYYIFRKRKFHKVEFAEGAFLQKCFVLQYSWAARSSPEQPRAAQSNPEQPRVAQSSPEQPRTVQNSPGQPRAAQSSQGNLEQPGAVKSNPERTVCQRQHAAVLAQSCSSLARARGLLCGLGPEILQNGCLEASWDQGAGRARRNH